MKSGCCVMLSILVLLLFVVQVSVAVQCVDSSIQTFKTCSACAGYSCPGTNASAGCPEDFYRDCSNQTTAIELIKNKNPYDIEYVNRAVMYVSGCGDKDNGQQCMIDKVDSFKKAMKKLFLDGKLENSTVYWRTPSCSSLDDESKCNNSNGQNGALKFIGVISIGWILFAA